VVRESISYTALILLFCDFFCVVERRQINMGLKLVFVLAVVGMCLVQIEGQQMFHYSKW